MTKKITKPIMKENKQAKKRDNESKSSPWLEDYMDCFTLKMKPITEAFIHRISLELMAWAEKDEDAIKLEQFYTPKRIPRSTFDRWADKYEVLGRAKEIAFSYISSRRELNALNRKYDASTNNNMMPKYDKDWKAMAEWRNKLKIDAQEKDSGTKIVVIEKFASSDLVPDLPIADRPVLEKSLKGLTPEDIATEVSMKGKNALKAYQ